MKVAIRTDASLLIGSGHVMRCKTLAEELRKRGSEVLFICRNHRGALIPLLTETDYSVMALPAPNSMNPIRPDMPDDYSAWLGVEQSVDTQQTIEALGNFRPDWLVVDHYGLDESWERKLREHVGKVFVIDDLVNRPHDCDVLLNQNLLGDLDKAYESLVSDHCRKLLGPTFALLRPEFRKARETLRQRDGTIRRILVFFGGVDPTGETEKALDAIDQLDAPDIAVDVVVGANNPRAEIIQAICQGMPNVTFHQQVSNMAQLMAAADLTIGAGGTASWERCCLGLPSLVTIVADNQATPTSNLANSGGVMILGTSARLGTQDYLSAITNLEPEGLRQMQTTCLDLVDGRGLERVILSIYGDPVRLRRANHQDARKVWPWRNHPDTRRYSINSSPISLETHLSWWKQSLCDPSRIILIGCCDESEIGVLRYDLIDEYKAEVSIYLDPGLHGLGLGTSLLRAGQKWILRNLPNVVKVNATIVDKNVASKRAFASAGFRQNYISMIWVKDADSPHGN
jgi:UDP-2,4-diacetamido-2,4,6-trideoxy-beta-L-altropyranose hydrolase